MVRTKTKRGRIRTNESSQPTQRWEDLDELHRRYRAGDPTAESRLLVACLPIIKYLAQLLHRSPHIQEDLVQEGLLGLNQKILPSYTQERAAVRNYIYEPLKRVMIDALRSMKMRTRNGRVLPYLISHSDEEPLPSFSESQGPETSEHAVLTKQLKSRFETLSEHLPEHLYAIMRLHYGLRGSTAMTLKEIGQLRGISEPRVSQLHQKALELLRDTFTDLSEEDL